MAGHGGRTGFGPNAHFIVLLTKVPLQIEFVHVTWPWFKTNGIGAPPILVYFSGDWDVHWGYDLDLDPWPHRCFALVVVWVWVKIKPPKKPPALVVGSIYQGSILGTHF